MRQKYLWIFNCHLSGASELTWVGMVASSSKCRTTFHLWYDQLRWWLGQAIFLKVEKKTKTLSHRVNIFWIFGSLRSPGGLLLIDEPVFLKISIHSINDFLLEQHHFKETWKEQEKLRIEIIDSLVFKKTFQQQMHYVHRSQQWLWLNNKSLGRWSYHYDLSKSTRTSR